MEPTTQAGLVFALLAMLVLLLGSIVSRRRRERAEAEQDEAGYDDEPQVPAAEAVEGSRARGCPDPGRGCAGGGRLRPGRAPQAPVPPHEERPRRGRRRARAPGSEARAATTAGEPARLPRYLGHALAFRGHLREAFAVNESLLRQPSVSKWSWFLDPLLDLTLLGIIPDSLARVTFDRVLGKNALLGGGSSLHAI